MTPFSLFCPSGLQPASLCTIISGYPVFLRSKYTLSVFSVTLTRYIRIKSESMHILRFSHFH